MECVEKATITRGALSIVLQIARVAGVAPLSFRKLRNGYSISVSRFQSAYGFFVITTFNVFGFIGLYLNMKDMQLTDFKLLSIKGLVLAEHMMNILPSLVGYMAPNRMKNMIHNLNSLEKIRTTINCGYNPAKEDKNMMWMCCFIIFANFCFTVLEVFLSTLGGPEWDYVGTLLALHFLEYNILIILKMQIVVINFEVYKVLWELNAKLRSIRTIVEHDHLPIAKAQMIKNEIRRLSPCYVSVCDIVSKISNAEGFYILVIYTCLEMLAVFDGYQLILALYQPGTTFGDFILRFGWCTNVILRTALFVEPFHRISEQVAEMKVLITQLLFPMTPLGKQVTIEFDIMIKELLLNFPQYHPLGLHTLNRSLITTTFDIITTILVFMIQLQS